MRSIEERIDEYLVEDGLCRSGGRSSAHATPSDSQFAAARSGTSCGKLCLPNLRKKQEPTTVYLPPPPMGDSALLDENLDTVLEWLDREAHRIFKQELAARAELHAENEEKILGIRRKLAQLYPNRTLSHSFAEGTDLATASGHESATASGQESPRSTSTASTVQLWTASSPSSANGPQEAGKTDTGGGGGAAPVSPAGGEHCSPAAQGSAPAVAQPPGDPSSLPSAWSARTLSSQHIVRTSGACLSYGTSSAEWTASMHAESFITRMYGSRWVPVGACMASDGDPLTPHQRYKENTRFWAIQLADMDERLAMQSLEMRCLRDELSSLRIRVKTYSKLGQHGACLPEAGQLLPTGSVSRPRSRSGESRM